jgi:hypothetical protein
MNISAQASHVDELDCFENFDWKPSVTASWWFETLSGSPLLCITLRMGVSMSPARLSDTSLSLFWVSSQWRSATPHSGLIDPAYSALA